MDTDITTAARRIARDINTTPDTVTRYFDAQGYAQGHHEGAALLLTGRKGGVRMTEREAQDHLDAAAATGEISAREHGGYFAKLEIARAVAR